MVHGAETSEDQSPGVSDPRGPQHNLTELQRDLLDRGHVASKALKGMTFKRRIVLCGGSSANTMQSHLWAALVFSKGQPSSTPAFVKDLWARTAEPGPPQMHLPQVHLGSGKHSDNVHIHRVSREDLSRYKLPAQGLFHSRNSFQLCGKPVRAGIHPAFSEEVVPVLVVGIAS